MRASASWNGEHADGEVQELLLQGVVVEILDRRALLNGAEAAGLLFGVGFCQPLG
ncbi:hypothetical protein [Streptomyces sp. NPDC005865]|uniref:hypothetical protein n=1 Tax=Streptomyces sp. NPDC005865 TaxID=3155453 RepID=UPI0033C2E10C